MKSVSRRPLCERRATLFVGTKNLILLDEFFEWAARGTRLQSRNCRLAAEFAG
jgi:hypothetical protein